MQHPRVSISDWSSYSQHSTHPLKEEVDQKAGSGRKGLFCVKFKLIQITVHYHRILENSQPNISNHHPLHCTLIQTSALYLKY